MFFPNVALDENRPPSVGEVVANNADPLDGTRVKALFNRARIIRENTDFAACPLHGMAFSGCGCDRCKPCWGLSFTAVTYPWV